MFAQISPSSADLGETVCSLNFASRVRGIENGPVRKLTDPSESFKLKQMVPSVKRQDCYNFFIVVLFCYEGEIVFFFKLKVI